MKDTQKPNLWTVVLRVVITVATALLGLIGGTEAYTRLS